MLARTRSSSAWKRSVEVLRWTAHFCGLRIPTFRERTSNLHPSAEGRRLMSELPRKKECLLPWFALARYPTFNNKDVSDRAVRDACLGDGEGVC